MTSLYCISDNLPLINIQQWRCHQRTSGGDSCHCCVWGVQCEKDHCTLWSLSTADYHINHTVMKSDILWSVSECSWWSMPPGGHPHQPLPASSPAVEDVLCWKHWRSKKRHDSRSATYVLQARKGQIKQEDDRVFHNDNWSICKLKGIPFTAKQVLKVVEHDPLHGCHQIVCQGYWPEMVRLTWSCNLGDRDHTGGLHRLGTLSRLRLRLEMCRITLQSAKDIIWQLTVIREFWSGSFKHSIPRERYQPLHMIVDATGPG